MCPADIKDHGRPNPYHTGAQICTSPQGPRHVRLIRAPDMTERARGGGGGAARGGEEMGREGED